MLPNHPNNNKHFGPRNLLGSLRGSLRRKFRGTLRRNLHKTIFRAFHLGLISALIGILAHLVPPFSHFEHDIGLDWLMQLRGPMPAPSNVIIAAMDRESSDALGYPNLPRKWSRQVHADLINILTKLGTPAIGFDVLFNEPRNPQDDTALAQALSRSGRAILFENLYTINQTGMRIEQLQAPISELSHAARATAPFALPKVPARVSQAWLHKGGAGDSATLPVVMLYLYLHDSYPSFTRLIRERLQPLTSSLPAWLDAPMDNPRETAERVYRLFQQYPSLQQSIGRALNHLPKKAIPATDREAIRSWLYTLAHNNSIVLNLYGPARSIHTVPYHRLLAPDDALKKELKHSAVFLGFSEILQPEQKDGFYTAFTDGSGVDISGVELMATTFANLLHRKAISPLPFWKQLLVVAAFGLVLGSALFLLPGFSIPLVVAFSGGGWLILAMFLFSHFNLWIPLTTPLLIQLPLTLLLALGWRYHVSQQEKQRVTHQFGQFLPTEIVNSAQNNTSDSRIEEGSICQLACLFTDMQGYTGMAEKSTPEKLHASLNKYFAVLYDPVYKRGGLVTDMAGDSMVAVWHKLDPGSNNLAACDAALQIQTLLEEHQYPTRLGLHSGEAFLGIVGSEVHREYRAIGDAVNTAARIQAANKVLGTQILASANIVQGFTQINRRYLGKFLFRGKQHPIELYELHQKSRHTKNTDQRLSTEFGSALKLWQARDWKEAGIYFEVVHKRYDHGPSRFYAMLCEQRRLSRKKNLNGIVVLDQV